jgi:hypothetical protein
MLFQAAAALFAVYMLVRHGPSAYAALRGRRPGGRLGAAIPILNVVLAFAILVVAVKGLAEALISR